jgi:queuine/archaeosine tRNA-ribosyltransferase
MLAATLVTSHNLWFVQRLLARARAAILAGTFADFARPPLELEPD